MRESLILTLAKAAQDTYSAPSGLTGYWSREERHDDGNFRACLYVPNHKGVSAIVAFRGSDNWQDWAFADVAGIGLSLNALSMKLNTAIEFTSQMKMTFPDLWLTGHSLGGAFVQLVSAICELPGMTFNSPGVLHLLNQMSSNPLVKIAGGLGSPLLSWYTRGFTSFLNQAAAGSEDLAFQTVSNYRSTYDPVSLIGNHVGSPMTTIEVATASPHPHHMAPLIDALAKKSS